MVISALIISIAAPQLESAKQIRRFRPSDVAETAKAHFIHMDDAGLCLRPAARDQGCFPVG
jgi:hypothetical protein